MRRLEQTILIAICLIMVVIAVAGLSASSMGQNLSGQQAISFLRGAVDIPDTPPNRAQDAALFNGRAYNPFPPLPALLMLPFIALFGSNAPISLLLLPVLALTAWYFWRLLKAQSEISFPNYWLLIAFLFGTAVYPTLIYGFAVWQSAQLIGMMFVVIALWASFSTAPRKHIYVGIVLACAFLCRQLTVLLIPIFPVILWEQLSATEDRAAKWRRFGTQLIGFALPLIVAGGLYLGFNYVRFGNALDTGYNYLAPKDNIGVPPRKFGLYAPQYFFYNATYFFFQGFHVDFGGADNLEIQGVDLAGSSLLVASPFLLAAFYARGSRRLLVVSWLVIAVMVVSQLFYHNNGFAQVNNHRFSMDYLPILMLLAASGVQSFPRSFIKGMIWWSLALNVFAVAVALLTFGLPR
ncbi:MAG: hypothetical protein KF726_02915 [Anaerolineae bacterium]|nr:hypothetical protein [Anaerolineae bacterium]